MATWGSRHCILPRIETYAPRKVSPKVLSRHISNRWKTDEFIVFQLRTGIIKGPHRGKFLRPPKTGFFHPRVEAPTSVSELVHILCVTVVHPEIDGLRQGQRAERQIRVSRTLAANSNSSAGSPTLVGSCVKFPRRWQTSAAAKHAIQRVVEYQLLKREAAQASICLQANQRLLSFVLQGCSVD